MPLPALPQLLRPRALKPGDLVVVASLSGPLHSVYEPNLDHGVVVLERMGFRVRRAPLLEAGRHHWWSAATPVEIAREFNALLRDPEVRAIIAHDGGQTALGYLDLIDVEAITADPKPILGYSDISLLHLVLHARTGLVGFHADVATTGLGGHWQAAPAARRGELERLYSTLLTGTEPIGALPATPAWECWRAGRTEGRLIGGLLNRIVLAQATRFSLPLERFDGAVLFWEETGGQASHLWSYLQVLRHSGILDRISGMVVGVPHAIDGPGGLTRPRRSLRCPPRCPRRPCHTGPGRCRVRTCRPREGTGRLSTTHASAGRTALPRRVMAPPDPQLSTSRAESPPS